MIKLAGAMALVLFTGLLSCRHEKPESPIDRELYELASSASAFTWFAHTDVLLDKSNGSGHPQPFLRTRYNAIAAAMLGADGRILSGAEFSEGSLIVKELFQNQTQLSRFAILYKNSASPHADAKGWVWGYIDADGAVAVPSSDKGVACISCHSQAGNIDYMLMNKYFP